MTGQRKGSDLQVRHKVLVTLHRFACGTHPRNVTSAFAPVTLIGSAVRGSNILCVSPHDMRVAQGKKNEKDKKDTKDKTDTKDTKDKTDEKNKEDKEDKKGKKDTEDKKDNEDTKTRRTLDWECCPGGAPSCVFHPMSCEWRSL